jgi:hypothetical protein
MDSLRGLIYDEYDPADYAEASFYNECTGEHYPLRSAGDRYTGPKRDVIAERFLQGDALAVVARCRKQLLAKRTPPTTEAGYQWQRMNARNHYDIARMRAFSQSSRVGLRKAERLANDVRLFAALRGAA